MICPPIIGLALLALALASCAGPETPAPSLASAGPPPSAPGGRPSPAAVAACRQRADEIYLKQNRALLSERNQSLSPYSSTGLPDNPAQGLGELYGRGQNFTDCLRNYGPASPSGPGPAVGGTGANFGPGMKPVGNSGPVTVGPQ